MIGVFYNDRRKYRRQRGRGARRAQIADQEDSILSHQEHVAILAAKTVESR